MSNSVTRALSPIPRLYHSSLVFYTKAKYIRQNSDSESLRSKKLQAQYIYIYIYIHPPWHTADHERVRHLQDLAGGGKVDPDVAAPFARSGRRPSRNGPQPHIIYNQYNAETHMKITNVFFFIVQLLHNIFEHVYNPGN